MYFEELENSWKNLSTICVFREEKKTNVQSTRKWIRNERKKNE